MGGRTASVSSLRAACGATVRRIPLESAKPTSCGTSCGDDSVVSPRAGPPSRTLVRLAVSLLPQLLAERCPVDFTLMSWETLRHLMRCPRFCQYCTTVEELTKFMVVSSPFVISGAHTVANLRSSNFGDSNVLDLLHTCPITLTAWPGRFSAYRDAPGFDGTSF